MLSLALPREAIETYILRARNVEHAWPTYHAAFISDNQSVQFYKENSVISSIYAMDFLLLSRYERYR